MRFAVLFLLLLSCTGCAVFIPNPPCPPPPSAKPPITDTFSCFAPTVPPAIPAPELAQNLSDLVALALENSPLTRIAWFKTKAAAADVGIARGAYLPPVEFSANWVKEQFLIVGEPGFVLPVKQTNADITLSTAYLLFDFGGRNGNLEKSLAALSAMNWMYNWEVQTVILGVMRSYYNYINAREIYKVSLQTVADNQTAVDAALELVKHGAKSKADYLQAETSLLQSQVALEQSKGSLNVAMATLAQSVALPPETPFCVAPLPDSLPMEQVCKDVDLILDAAKRNRADLAAYRERILETKGKIKSIRSTFFPNITTEIIGGKGWINERGPLNEYSVTFNLNYPIFNSFTDINNLRKAQAELEAAQGELDANELTAFLAVLTDYYEFNANTQILKYSEKYLQTSLESQEAVYQNYIAGANSILDLLAANHALNVARIQLADAKTNFLTSLANLAYDTGGLSANSFHNQEELCAQ